jgi:hypothetical protein
MLLTTIYTTHYTTNITVFHNTLTQTHTNTGLDGQEGLSRSEDDVMSVLVTADAFQQSHELFAKVGVCDCVCVCVLLYHIVSTLHTHTHTHTQSLELLDANVRALCVGFNAPRFHVAPNLYQVLKRL